MFKEYAGFCYFTKVGSKSSASHWRASAPCAQAALRTAGWLVTDVSRSRKSYCLLASMRWTPLFVKAIWLTNGELARYVYDAEFVPSLTLCKRDAPSQVLRVCVSQVEP